MSNIVRWFWWCLSCVHSAGGLNEYFGERDFFAGGVFGGEVIQVGADETAV
jgi:hypothetical protein